MHLAVVADDFPGLIDNGGSVVIDARRATLEDRRDDDDFPRLGHGAERFGGGSGNRFGEIEKFRVLGLTRVVRAEQLLSADDLRAAPGGLLDFGDCLVEIEARLGRTAHLNESNGDLVGARFHDNCDSKRGAARAITPILTRRPTIGAGCRTIELRRARKIFVISSCMSGVVIM
jgi:hypothetical protein